MKLESVLYFFKSIFVGFILLFIFGAIPMILLFKYPRQCAEVSLALGTLFLSHAIGKMYLDYRSYAEFDAWWKQAQERHHKEHGVV